MDENNNKIEHIEIITPVIKEKTIQDENNINDINWNTSSLVLRSNRMTRLNTEYVKDPYRVMSCNNLTTKSKNSSSPRRNIMPNIFSHPDNNPPNSPKNFSMDDEKEKESIYSEEEKICSIPFMARCLGSIGVVFGDLMTSPVYTPTAVYHPMIFNEKRLPHEKEILGATSTIIWMLIIIVCIKYCCFVMYADYNGEGGSFAIYEKLLHAFSNFSIKKKKKLATYIMLITIMSCLGASLLLGDCVITPAISILSALEGILLIQKEFEEYIVMASVFIIIFLYAMQSFGSRILGNIFGPVLFIWSLLMGAIGLYNITLSPKILMSLSPHIAFSWWFKKGAYSANFTDLANIILCSTGTEAMFADMGHFGRKSITFSWFVVLLPTLIWQYLGQGAYLLTLLENKNIDNIGINMQILRKSVFWATIPRTSLIFYYFMLILATLSTIAASQSVITSAFTLMNQASNLNFLPRLNVVYTNPKEKGQIYIASVAVSHCILCCLLVIICKNSENLAAAFGAAVTSVFLLTNVLVFMFIAPICWSYPKKKWIPIFTLFFIFDLFIWTSTLEKFTRGAWFPFVLAIIAMSIMLFWSKTKLLVRKKLYEIRNEEKKVMPNIIKSNNNDIENQIIQSKGLGIFLISPESALLMDNRLDGLKFPLLYESNNDYIDNILPISLIRLISRFQVRPKYLLLVSIKSHSEPFVEEYERVEYHILNTNNNNKKRDSKKENEEENEKDIKIINDNINSLKEDNGIICHVTILFGWAEPKSSLCLMDYLINDAKREKSKDKVDIPDPIKKRLTSLDYTLHSDTDKKENLNDNDTTYNKILRIHLSDETNIDKNHNININDIEPLSIFTSKKLVKTDKKATILHKIMIKFYNILKTVMESNVISQYHLPPDNTTEIGVQVVINE